MNERMIKIEGVESIVGPSHHDSRGSFKKIISTYLLQNPSKIEWKQANISHNTYAGTTRGLHYDTRMNLEYKLVSCICGGLVDILVDLRPKSASYGKVDYFKLDDCTNNSILIPPGVAHGFQTTCDDTQILYLHSEEYSPDADGGINILDPALAITLPLGITEMSGRDKSLPYLKEIK